MNKKFFHFFSGPKKKKWAVFGSFLDHFWPQKPKNDPQKKIKKKFYSFSRLIIAWGTLYFFWSIFFFFSGPNFFFFFKNFYRVFGEPANEAVFFVPRAFRTWIAREGSGGGKPPSWGSARGARKPPIAAGARARRKSFGFFLTPSQAFLGADFGPNLDPKKMKNPKKNHFPSTFFFQTSYNPYLA